MNEHYSYDELYGTLLRSNEDDTERTYYIIECLRYKFIRWMFLYDWNVKSEKACERKGIRGFEIVLVLNKNGK